jgi:hypothetical protein
VVGLGVDGVTTGMVSERLKLAPSESMTLYEFASESARPFRFAVVLSAAGESADLNRHRNELGEFLCQHHVVECFAGSSVKAALNSQ